MSDHDAVRLGIENAFSHAAMLANEAISILRNAYERPSAVYRPSLVFNGKRWCAVYGDNVHCCSGFGDSPDAAMWDFDKAWHTKGKQ